MVRLFACHPSVVYTAIYMATLLTEVNTVEVSLVRRGANGKRFAIFKEDQMDKETFDDILDQVNDIDLGDDEVMKALTDAMEKQELSDRERNALRGAMRLLRGIPGAKLSGDLRKALNTLAQAAGYGAYKAPTDKSGHLDEDKDKDMKKQDSGSVKKEDLDGLPDETRAKIEILMKVAEEQKTNQERLEKELKDERDARVVKEFVEQVDSEFQNLSTTADEFGPILKEMNESMSKESYDKVVDILKSADAAVKESKLFDEAGSNLSGGGSDAHSKLTSLAEELRKSDSSLSPEQAYTKVLDTPAGREIYNTHAQ